MTINGTTYTIASDSRTSWLTDTDGDAVSDIAIVQEAANRSETALYTADGDHVGYVLAMDVARAIYEAGDGAVASVEAVSPMLTGEWAGVDTADVVSELADLIG